MSAGRRIDALKKEVNTMEKIIKEGKDLTIIAIGKMVEKARKVS